MPRYDNAREAQFVLTAPDQYDLLVDGRLVATDVHPDDAASVFRTHRIPKGIKVSVDQ